MSCNQELFVFSSNCINSYIIHSCLHRMSHVSSESSSSDIFGALLQSEQHPTYAGLSSQMKKNWPIKIDGKNHRLIQDANIIDFFVFNENIIIVKDIDGRIKIQLLTTMHDEVECRTLLEFSKSKSHLQYPPNGTYMNFICQKATPSSASGIIELKRDLFSSLFTLTSALQNSLIFIYGDQNGKISTYPVAVGTERATASFIDTVDIFCDMGQPLLCVLFANVKQFFVCGKETTDSRSRDAIERQINNVKEAFGNENAMLLVGRCGKIIVVLNQIKQCAMTMFNTCHVLGPILTASAMNDFLIHATGDTLHLSQLSMSLHVQDKDKPSLSPSFKPVYSIALPISCISQNSISETEVSSRICFYCADTDGQLLDVVIDDKSDNQSNSELAPNINLLLKMLENSQGDFERLQSLLKKQDQMLEELQMAASLTADLIHDLEGNGNIGSQVLRPIVYCSLDSVLMGTDGKLYLDIRIHNTSQHMLSSNWFLQFVGEARQATNNMLYGNLKKFSMFFPLQSLQPKTDMQWKSSINVKELQVFLPIKVEFKLAIPFHESHISAEETASNGKNLFNILPLNSCIITIMDLLHVSDGQSLKGRSSRNNPTSQSNCSSSTCYFCHTLTGPHTYDSIAHCNRKTSPENHVVFSIPSLILQSFLQSVKPPNAEECAKIVMAHLFPFTSRSSFVEYGTSLHLELPCRQHARLSIIFDATNFARGTTTVPRLQLEGHCLSLLLAIHSAVVYRLMVSMCHFVFTSCTLTSLHLQDFQAVPYLCYPPLLIFRY